MWVKYHFPCMMTMAVR